MQAPLSLRRLQSRSPIASNLALQAQIATLLLFQRIGIAKLSIATCAIRIADFRMQDHFWAASIRHLM